MVGGLGNDTFVWEGTNPGTATFADGGPGDDEFSSENAKGPDTIVTGSGWDSVKVHNKSGDPETATCGPDGLAAIYFNPSDHIDKNCGLNAFAASLPVLTKALRRLRPQGREFVGDPPPGPT